MKLKIQKVKFLRNIIIGVVALFIVSFIINIAPGYKRNKYRNVINLVIGDENVTENLKNNIIKDDDGTLYISEADIKEYFDKTLYYDENENSIIATSEMSTARMKFGEKRININGTETDTLAEIKKEGDTIYIPIKDMRSVYNLEIKYLENKNILIIDKLSEGMIKAEADKTSTIRYKQRSLSKSLGELEEGDIVSAFYTTSKGWRLIRTEDGIVGYVKANVLTNEYILRQDMNQKPQTKSINANVSNNSNLKLEGTNVVVKDLLQVTLDEIFIKNTEIQNDENIETWVNLKLNNANLETYDDRIKLAKDITVIARKNGINGINVECNGKPGEKLERFIIELAPLMRELGIKTNIVSTTKIDEEKFTDIVNYIIITNG